ncbi:MULTISPECIES: GreA/GreB family elongation factor [Flagellimonas]|uniref:Transcription elongation factor GreA/GreB C-terminal domain-containing protein n=1 Tax=Flagellimonas hadalis TaxID=2597517 RepID=A0A5N5IWN6_9FLAO|nr:GreA/GreB family elongation factor [Allomuricauda hadalis]KAB5491533.1 hypothetical protein FOT42_000880 [Allomuricauda hadalis]
MKRNDLMMEKSDYVAIKKVLNFHKHYQDYAHKETLDALREQLENTTVCSASELPKGVVRLKSKVTVASKSGWWNTFQVMLHDDGDNKEGQISVKSTLGAALIGRSIGDVVLVGMPNSPLSLEIKEVKWAINEDEELAILKE